MTITGNPAWQRAMERALKDHQKPTLRVDGSFRVPSKSTPGAFHTVTVNDAGHITNCTCRGWDAYGRSNPCRHAGAVAQARSFAPPARAVQTLSTQS